MAALQVIVRCVPTEANLTLAVTLAGKLRTMNRLKAEPVGKVLQRLGLQLQGRQTETYCPVHGTVPVEARLDGDAAALPPISLLGPAGRAVDPDTPNEEAWQPGAVLLVEGERHVVRVNVPAVVGLQLPGTPLEGVELVPTFTLEFGEGAQCRWQWLRTPMAAPGKKGKAAAGDGRPSGVLVGDAATYTPTTADVGHHLALVCTPHAGDGGPGLPASCTATNSVGAGPPNWPFGDRVPPGPAPPDVCRLVTYNVLASVYCDTEFARANLYPFCAPPFLKVDYRKQVLGKEIRGYSPDVVCLQEVEARQFADHWVPLLARDGLEGLFCRKASKQPLGIALFYRPAKLCLIASDRVDLTAAWRQYPEVRAICEEEPSVGRGLEISTTVAQVVQLRWEGSGAPLCVVNTHLFGHPRAPHVRLLQAYVLLREVERRVGQDCAIIFAGDLNALPAEGLHRLLRDGAAPADLPDWRVGAGWRPIETKEEREEAWFQPQSPVEVGEAYARASLTSPFSFSSACDNVPMTFPSAGHGAVVDYVYVSPRLAVRRAYAGFGEETLRREGGIPSAAFGSDHVSLVVDLALARQPGEDSR